MRINISKWFAAATALFMLSAQAQVLVDTWSYEGGGLDPATYGGNYRPPVLLPDAGSQGDSAISVTLSGPTGGLGSSGSAPDGYGYFYTLFSTASFTLEAATVLPGVDEISFTILAGGGDPTMIFLASTILLDFNEDHSALESSLFVVGEPITLETPVGEQTVTPYTWTWSNLSTLGVSSGFSANFSSLGSQHATFGGFTLTQTVPEPSVICLIALSGAAFILRRRYRMTGE